MIPLIEIDNPGFVFRDGWPPHNAIVAITGLPRSGTTYVAELLQAAGVIPLCHQSGPPDPAHRPGTYCRALEDPEMAASVETRDRRRAELLITSRPPRWMFKQPNIHSAASFLRAILGRRLTWVIVFRDVLAIAIREHLWRDYPISALLSEVAEGMAELVDFVMSAPEPKLLVSYEKARQFPCQLKYHFSKWVEQCVS